MRRITSLAIVAAAGIAAGSAVAGGAADKVTGEFMRGNCWDCSPGDELGFVAHRLISAHEAFGKHAQKGFLLSWRDDGAWFEMDFSDPAETCVHVYGDGLVRMGWDVTIPKAGMFLWVKIPEPYDRMGSVRFAIEMMNRANVAVAPGAGFGEEGDGWLRLALVENENRIRQALKQMRQSLKEIDQEVEAGTFDLDAKGPTTI